MRAAVTGATGFVGGHLVDALRARGDEVACLARDARRAEPLAGAGCRIVRGDLDSGAALDDLVRGVDVVFHVAGAIAARNEAAFLRVNRDGTARVAEAARRAGAPRLVCVSSLAVTGPAERGRPVDDTTPPRPVTPYGRSKLAGEEAVRAAGVPFVIVRPPTVYGPRDRELLRVFRLAARGLGVLLGDGRQELSLIHGADLARALVAAAGGPAGRVYHAAAPEVVDQRALMAAVGRAVGRRPRLLRVPPLLVRAALHVTGATAHVLGRATILSPDKAGEFLAAAWTCRSDALAADTGWRAEIPLERGLADTARWYRQQAWL